MTEAGWISARRLLGGGVGKAAIQVAAALRQQRAPISVIRVTPAVLQKRTLPVTTLEVVVAPFRDFCGRRQKGPVPDTLCLRTAQ
jgi:hypothetical protein